MYNKIMPTYYEGDDIAQTKKTENAGSVVESPFAEDSDVFITEPENGALLQNKEIQRLQDRDNKAVLVNLTENLALSKLEMVLRNMNCCKCDRCKMDIIALALNQLPPHYVVGAKAEIDGKSEENEISQQVTSAVLKAALVVRKQPRH